ncbi:hypothetical protein [Paenibacillus peoriae]|uniref:hypothetical protein n=1 Tax=Paenibacillus peoriae TaxID=59893 RepID=UPI00096DB7CC|nr:hypothetical protein [Paenibacillus peoriae]OMF50860.1 hypothetical protein BK135_00940 [Paenibacillus peoriae]
MSTRGRAAHTCKVFGEPCETDVNAGEKAAAQLIPFSCGQFLDPANIQIQARERRETAAFFAFEKGE